MRKSVCKKVDPLSASSTEWSDTLKQFIDNLPKNCLSVFDHFVGLALKRLTAKSWQLHVFYFISNSIIRVQARVAQGFPCFQPQSCLWVTWHSRHQVIPIDTGRKLNVHKTFRRRPQRLLNVLCTFSLHPVPTGMFFMNSPYIQVWV